MNVRCYDDCGFLCRTLGWSQFAIVSIQRVVAYQDLHRECDTILPLG